MRSVVEALCGFCSGSPAASCAAAAPVALVVAAAYDAPRRGLLLNDRWRRWWRRAPRWTLAACGAVVSAAAAARVAGTEGVGLGAANGARPGGAGGRRPAGPKPYGVRSIRPAPVTG
jgi:hypothetical protein